MPSFATTYACANDVPYPIYIGGDNEGQGVLGHRQFPTAAMSTHSFLSYIRAPTLMLRSETIIHIIIELNDRSEPRVMVT